MSLNILIGILLIGTGAFSSGSFAVPFGKIKGWKWETYWMVFSVGAYVLFPLTACLIFAPDFIKIIQSTSSSTAISVFLLGAVYGIGNLSFGLALRYLGLSLGYALSLGLMLALGTLVPIHSCGSISMLMPELIEAGIEIFNPVQTNSWNMAPDFLKKEFGQDCTFWGGGIETVGTLNIGTPQQIRDQVFERLEIFSKGGGFVFNTVHNILPDVPPQNIVAMFDAVDGFNSMRTSNQ